MSVTEPDAAPRRHEFVLDDRAFRWIQSTVKERVGINLTDAKREMVYNRLAGLLRQRGHVEVERYLEEIDRGEAPLTELINAVTTNVTHFFREAHHFERLSAGLVEIVSRHRHDETIRIWSAGCSSGEEAYSIAITLEQSLPIAARGWDVRVLATDLDTNVLATAREGVYPEHRIDGLDVSQRRWFQADSRDPEGSVRVRDELKRRLCFEQLNLMDPWPMDGLFDVIFCRNVVIYFDRPTQKRLFARFAERLPAGGHLFIGHSESLFDVSDAFEFVGQSSYRRRSPR